MTITHTTQFCLNENEYDIFQGRGGVLPGGQTPGGGAGGGNNEPAEPESGWSQILNSNPELKAIVNACERYYYYMNFKQCTYSLTLTIFPDYCLDFNENIKTNLVYKKK